MENKLFKGLLLMAAGSITYKTVMTIRERKLQKELYGPGLEEVVVDESQDKE